MKVLTSNDIFFNFLKCSVQIQIWEQVDGLLNSTAEKKNNILAPHLLYYTYVCSGEPSMTSANIFPSMQHTTGLFLDCEVYFNTISSFFLSSLLLTLLHWLLLREKKKKNLHSENKKAVASAGESDTDSGSQAPPTGCWWFFSSK